MIIDKEREERQLQGIERWKKNNYIGIFDYAPGVGKTYCTILAIKERERLEKQSHLIIVNSEILKEQWKEKVKILPKGVQQRVYIRTTGELLNENAIYKVGTVYVDEIHEYTTDERIKLINKDLIKYSAFLGLSGTTTAYSFKRILYLVPIIDVISVEEAKLKGWISDFVEYNLAINLTNDEKVTYDRLTETISKHLPKFNNDLSLATKVLFGGKDKNGLHWNGPNWARGIAQGKGWSPTLNLNFPQHKEIDDLWNPNHVIGYAKALVNATRGRAQLLYLASNKYSTTLELLKKFDKVKTIVFSESTEFADTFYNLTIKNNIPSVVYHSQLKTIMKPGKTGKLIKFGKTRLKREAIESIEKGTKRVLITAKSLDTGMDIPDIRLGITSSGTQSPVQYTQRRGRSTRKETDITLPVLLINIYAKDTQDEKWLNNKQRDIKHKVEWVTSIDEITYTPPSNEFNFTDL